MRVFVSPCDHGPCGLYRLVRPARVASGELDVTLADRRYMGWSHDYVNYLTKADTDVVVIQRPSSIDLAKAVSALRSRGIAVVVDMDDDLSCVDPASSAHLWATEHHEYASVACQDATLVTVTTPALAERYGSHGRVRVIDNYIPASWLDVPHKDSATVGWGGALHTHPGDLKVLGDSIRNLVGIGVDFKVVGPPAGVGRALGLDADPRGTGGVHIIEEWPLALSKVGIGIAPLAPTAFNEAKSRLKPLEYSALGVPWVASRTGPYKAFHSLGAGLLASTPSEWEKTLRRLAEDQSLRDELADAGRAIAKENTYEKNAWRWTEAWTDALDMEME